MKRKITALIIILLMTGCTPSFPVNVDPNTPDISMDETIHTTEGMQSETPRVPLLVPKVSSEIIDDNETPVITTVAPAETPQSPDITCVLSDYSAKFEGVESSFSSIEYYSESRLLFGKYSVMLIDGITSMIEFSEENLTIDNIQMQFEDYFRPTALFIVDMDVADETREILVWEYGTNDWIDNALFSYDGNTVTEVARFIGWAYIDGNGKLVLTNNVDGNVAARIAYPFITRTYFEYHNGKLEEISVPIKDKMYTFSDSYAYFNFYETPDAPSEEFAHELISSFRNSDEFSVLDYYDRDFAGKRFTILDHSELEVSYRGAWYFVLLEDGRKGIIHWWLAM